MDQSANRSSTAPWLYVVAALLLGTWALADGEVPGPWWRLAVVVLGISAPIVGWRLHRTPLIAIPALAIAGVRLGFGPVRSSDPVTGHVTTIDALVDIGIGLALAGTLAIVLARRRGHVSARDLVDGVGVTIGATLLAWVFIASPHVGDHGMGPLEAIIDSGYLPLTVLLATFTIDLAVTGLAKNRAMHFVIVAAITNLAAALIPHLLQSGGTGQRWSVLGHVSFVVALGLLCASGVHVDGPELLGRSVEPQDAGRDSAARLAIIALFVATPICVVAATRATSDADVMIRAGGTSLLAFLVVVRLAIAVRRSAAAQGELVRRLSRDELTGLPTRSQLVVTVAEALESTWRTEYQPTVIHLNIDRFKNINDSLGHYGANDVIVAVSSRLAQVADEYDASVARVGGDDFILFDPTTRTSQDAMQRVESIRTALSTVFAIGDQTVFVTASMGVAMAPRKRTVTAEEMLRRADIASHRAKSSGRNSVSIFDESMQAHLAHRMDVEQALYGAIGRREMHLYYQPIVDLTTGGLSGFEALIRWKRADGNLVPPGDFISIAEETGIICELGEWALHEALTALRGWIDSGLVGPTTTVSVNVSPRQIADPNFAAIVRTAVERTKATPELLWLEMTESMMLDEPDLARSTLQEIGDMGVRLALDDFGTGFSSLSLLRQFPIHRIKIDRSFVNGISENANDRSLVRTIIAMAHSMGLDLVAEGVETMNQLESLRDLDCTKAQGYLISRPVPVEAIRSTIVALGEVASMAVFANSLDEPDQVSHQVAVSHTVFDGKSPTHESRESTGHAWRTPMVAASQPIF